MKGERIINLGNHYILPDAINTSYLHSFMSAYLNTDGGTMEGQIDMNNNKIINPARTNFRERCSNKRFCGEKSCFTKRVAKKCISVPDDR